MASILSAGRAGGNASGDQGGDRVGQGFPYRRVRAGAGNVPGVPDGDQEPHRPAMSPALAGATVFYTSGAVLVLEILALRLLAPYVGVTLETYTATLATVLAGISVGTWVGGYAADRVDPRRLVGPLLVAGGVLSLLSVPLVRALGSGGGSSVLGL